MSFWYRMKIKSDILTHSERINTYSFQLSIFQIHIQCNLYGVYRDSQYFPDPETFKPERWLKENQMDKDKKALSNLVWGHGARMCIG